MNYFGNPLVLALKEKGGSAEEEWDNDDLRRFDTLSRYYYVCLFSILKLRVKVTVHSWKFNVYAPPLYACSA